jgi:hypothetical protein
MSTTLLLADREHATRASLERHLRNDGFEIVSANHARPDLVLAGDEVELERWRGEAPVILLGDAEADSVDRVRAFRRGCDDYGELACSCRCSTAGGRLGPVSCAAACLLAMLASGGRRGGASARSAVGWSPTPCVEADLVAATPR